MTLVERMVYERQRGKGSASAMNTPLSAPKDKALPKSLSDLRRDVLKRRSQVEVQRRELETYRKRVEDEAMKVERLKQTVKEKDSPFSPPVMPVSRKCSESRPSTASPKDGTPSGSRVEGKQYCVSPVFALKRFFTCWTITGRSSRSEFWWVFLFVRIPLTNLERMVGDTALLTMVGVLDLILLWPFFCLQIRRFHDIGWSTAVGISVLFLPIATMMGAAALFDRASSCLSVGLGVCLALVFYGIMLSDVAVSRPANKYGPVPNTR